MKSQYSILWKEILSWFIAFLISLEELVKYSIHSKKKRERDRGERKRRRKWMRIRKKNGKKLKRGWRGGKWKIKTEVWIVKEKKKWGKAAMAAGKAAAAAPPPPLPSAMADDGGEGGKPRI